MVETLSTTEITTALIEDGNRQEALVILLRQVVDRTRQASTPQIAALTLLDEYLEAMDLCQTCPYDLSKTPVAEVIPEESLVTFQTAVNILLAANEQLESGVEEFLDPSSALTIANKAVTLIFQRNWEIEQLAENEAALLATEDELDKADLKMGEIQRQIRQPPIIDRIIFQAESDPSRSE